MPPFEHLLFGCTRSLSDMDWTTQCTDHSCIVHFSLTQFFYLIIISIMRTMFVICCSEPCLPSTSRCTTEKVMPYANDAINIAVTAVDIFISLRRNRTLSICRRTKMTHIHICRRRRWRRRHHRLNASHSLFISLIWERHASATRNGHRFSYSALH